jgi:hypothetical protein
MDRNTLAGLRRVLVEAVAEIRKTLSSEEAEQRPELMRAALAVVACELDVLILLVPEDPRLLERDDAGRLPEHYRGAMIADPPVPHHTTAESDSSGSVAEGMPGLAKENLQRRRRQDEERWSAEEAARREPERNRMVIASSLGMSAGVEVDAEQGGGGEEDQE